MFSQGGREDRTSWTLNYFDISCMNYFAKREGGSSKREGGREDSTSRTLQYFDVSCVIYFVQRGREGGQNIMDFESLGCFMREFL